MYFEFALRWFMRDTSIVQLNKIYFNNCLCHLELGVPQQLKLLQGLGMVHRSQIVYESYSSHDNNVACLVLCLTLVKVNFTILVVFSFVLTHTCTFIAGCHDEYNCPLNEKFTVVSAI